MRVVAGSLGGRIFDAPKGHRMRPMSDRVKQALFNSLGDINGLKVLDAFSGSGALAIESYSRGASFVQAIEKDSQTFKVLVKNLNNLEIAEAKLKATRANCGSWSKNNEKQKFDLIICDPPYDNLQLSTITTLVEHLSKNGLMVLSHSGRKTSPTVNGVVVVDNRVYGDAALSYYRYEA